MGILKIKSIYVYVDFLTYKLRDILNLREGLSGWKGAVMVAKVSN